MPTPFFGAQARTTGLTTTAEGTTLLLRGLRPGLYGYVVRLQDGTSQRGTLVVK